MEAHVGRLRIRTRTQPRSISLRLRLIRQRARARRRERAIAAHEIRSRSIPGSEHSHLLEFRPRGF
jgi:hypothetical protein